MEPHRWDVARRRHVEAGFETPPPALRCKFALRQTLIRHYISLAHGRTIVHADRSACDALHELTHRCLQFDAPNGTNLSANSVNPQFIFYDRPTAVSAAPCP